MTKTLTPKNYFIIAAAGLLMIFMMAATANAYGPGHHGYGHKGMGFHGKDFGPGVDQYLVDNGVSAETVNKYRVEMDKFRADNKAAMDSMRAKSLELYEEMQKTAPDAAKAKALQAELAKMRADLDAKKLDHYLSLKQNYPQICEIMQQKHMYKNFGHGPAGKPWHKGNPGPDGAAKARP